MARRTSSTYRRAFLNRRGFTLVELLASITIVAILVCTALPFVADYTDIAFDCADRVTLATLNNAVHTYEVLGGDITALTEGAPIANILTRLSTPITANGLNKSALRTNFTLPARSISAAGNGLRYHFTRFHSVSGL